MPVAALGAAAGVGQAAAVAAAAHPCTLAAQLQLVHRTPAVPRLAHLALYLTCVPHWLAVPAAAAWAAVAAWQRRPWLACGGLVPPQTPSLPCSVACSRMPPLSFLRCTASRHHDPARRLRTGAVCFLPTRPRHCGCIHVFCVALGHNLLCLPRWYCVTPTGLPPSPFPAACCAVPLITCCHCGDDMRCARAVCLSGCCLLATQPA